MITCRADRSNATEVGDIVCKVRKAQGRTIREVAKYAAIPSAEFLCLFEQGKRKMPLDRIPLLAGALGLDRKELTKLSLYEQHPRAYRVLYGDRPPQKPAEEWEVVDQVASFDDELLTMFHALPTDVKDSFINMLRQLYEKNQEVIR